MQTRQNTPNHETGAQLPVNSNSTLKILVQMLWLIAVLVTLQVTLPTILSITTYLVQGCEGQEHTEEDCLLKGSHTTHIFQLITKHFRKWVSCFSIQCYCTRDHLLSTWSVAIETLHLATSLISTTHTLQSVWWCLPNQSVCDMIGTAARRSSSSDKIQDITSHTHWTCHIIKCRCIKT